MNFWMDISRDDDGTVMSVVAGCNKCDLRTVTNDLEEAKSWITANATQFHDPTESRRIDQIGESWKISAGRYNPTLSPKGSSYAPQSTVSQDITLALLEEHGTMDTYRMAELLGKRYNTVYKTLDRLAKRDLIKKVQEGRKVLWEPQNGASQPLEQKVPTMTAPAEDKPSEGLPELRVEAPYITVKGQKRLMTAKEQELHTAFTEQGFVPRSTTSEAYEAKWAEFVAEVETPKLVRPYYGNPDILQGFGDHADIYGRFGFKGHMGLDIGIAMQPVLAAHDGTVEFAGDGGEWPIMGSAAGNCILLDGDTLRTGYAHLHHSYVAVGDKVKAGDVIAISGDTGATTGYHLHFEVLPKPTQHKNGYAGRVDPTPYLPAVEAPLAEGVGHEQLWW